MYDIFSNSTDNNNSNHAKFLRFLRSLKVDGILINDNHKQLHHFSANTPVTYGLPKVRKPVVPLRTILSARGSFNHEAAKLLKGKLSFL